MVQLKMVSGYFLLIHFIVEQVVSVVMQIEAGLHRTFVSDLNCYNQMVYEFYPRFLKRFVEYDESFDDLMYAISYHRFCE